MSKTEQNGMKRITSLDFARGLAVIGMTVFHAFLNNWTFFNEGLGSLKWWGYPFALIFYIFGHWRGFFLMVSAVVHIYSMERSYKKDQNIGKILLKQIVMGTLLWGFGALYNAFFNTWGAIDNWHRTGSWSWEIARNFVFFTEALQNIAFGIIIASIIFALIVATKSKEKVLQNVLGIGITAFMVIILTPWIQLGFSEILGANIALMDPSTPTTVNSFVQYILVQIAGRESPIFPMLASTLIGVIVGYLLIQEKPPEKMFKVGFFTALGMFIFGAAYLGIVDLAILGRPMFTVWDAGSPVEDGVFLFYSIHPVWFAFVNGGFELAALLLLLKKVEFNPKLNQEKWLKGSRWVRRWGVIALSVFFFQVLVFIPEKLVAVMLGLDPLAFGRYQLGFGMSIVVAIFFYWMVEGIIRLWELGRFIGSFEWLFVYFNIFTSGRLKEIDHLDPLRSKGIIYDVEPVMFVELAQAAAAPSEEKS